VLLIKTFFRINADKTVICSTHKHFKLQVFVYPDVLDVKFSD